MPWRDVNQALQGALLQHLTVRDAAGRSLPYQVTNVAPEAKDPQGKGIAYGELIFQHDFAAGEHSASFTVEKSEAVAPPFPVQAFARYVPERLDDFAWENDRIAHRTYGQALAAPDAQGSGKEVLVTSGLDIWFKRVRYPVVDRWYNKGHDHYHKDEGEGLDMYGVGTTRGAGGTGIWDGKLLHTSRNYASWKVIANGPIRAIFELRYDAWDAAGASVSEVKRFTVDAGHDFDQIDSTFSFSGPAQLTAAIGLNKTPAYAPQQPTVAATPLPAARADPVGDPAQRRRLRRGHRAAGRRAGLCRRRHQRADPGAGASGPAAALLRGRHRQLVRRGARCRRLAATGRRLCRPPAGTVVHPPAPPAVTSLPRPAVAARCPPAATAMLRQHNRTSPLTVLFDIYPSVDNSTSVRNSFYTE